MNQPTGKYLLDQLMYPRQPNAWRYDQKTSSALLRTTPSIVIAAAAFSNEHLLNPNNLHGQSFSNELIVLIL